MRACFLLFVVITEIIDSRLQYNMIAILVTCILSLIPDSEMSPINNQQSQSSIMLLHDDRMSQTQCQRQQGICKILSFVLKREHPCVFEISTTVRGSW